MNQNLVAILFILGVIALMALVEFSPKLIHLVIHHHFPFYKYLGYDNEGFDEYGDECLRCR